MGATKSMAMKLKTDSNKQLALLDLPPEIRNMIYKHLLPTSTVNILLGRLRPGLMNRSSPTNYSRYRSLIALLRTNRQIHGETAHLAYGATTLMIHTDVDTLQCLKDMGSMKRHIRSVEMIVIYEAQFKGIFHQLKQATQLQTVIFPPESQAHRNGERGCKAVWAAKNLVPFVKALKKKQGWEGVRREITRMFHAPSDSEYERAEGWEEELRTKLIEILS